MKIWAYVQNKIFYSDSLYYESLTYLTQMIVHTFIKNIFLHTNPRFNYYNNVKI